MTGRLPRSVRQDVVAEAGYAYGVIGADLHVVAGRGPAYLLTNREPASAPDDSGFPAQPSYLLSARAAVVDFTGRRGEVADLTAWRDSGHRVAVRWLHAPGGQGKTRLAGHLADVSARDGWKVIVAEHTAGRIDARSPASQDLRIGAAAGLLLLVDYADRWPLTHLTWLLGNKVLNQDVPVRVLLLARTAHVWPALCHALVESGRTPEACTSQWLGPLSTTHGSRARMFTAARDSFARRYGLTSPQAIGVPDGLEHDDFGLTLAVQMAALVAVDHHARSAAQPPLEDMTGLTAYLLDRERHHWQTLYDTGADPAGGRATFDTMPDQMARAVFTAALTGPVGYRDAKAALEIVGAGSDRVLADHTFCYPPADPATVLAPLYPDRLAEDLLALCHPGHHLPGPWAAAWAEGAAKLLLTSDGGLPDYAPRAVTFLATASDRWPHLLPTLTALEPLIEDLPGTAAADLAERLADHRLTTTTDPAERAGIHTELARRLAAADQNERAAAAYREAVRLYRALADEDLTAEPTLANALLFSAGHVIATTAHGGDWLTNDINLAHQGSRWIPPRQREAAMTAVGDAVEALGIFRRLTRELPAEYAARYVGEQDISAQLASMTASMAGSADMAARFVVDALTITERWAQARPHVSEVLTHPRHDDATRLADLRNAVMVSLNLERPDEALPMVEEAVDIARRLADDDHLLSALMSYAGVLQWLDRYDEARHTMHDVVRIARERARDDPAAHADGLRVALEAFVQLLSGEHRWDEALPAAREAVGIARQLARDDPVRHEKSLAGNLSHLANVLLELGRRDEEVPVLEEAVALRRRLAQDDPALHEHVLAAQLAQLSTALVERRRWRDALTAATESMEIFHRAVRHVQYGVEAHLAGAVDALVKPEGQRPPEAAFDGDLAKLVELAGPRRATVPELTDAIEEARRRFVVDNPAGPLYRRLTGADPLSADTEAMTLRSQGRHDEALSPACEEASNHLRLDAPLRVDALVRLAAILGEMGQSMAATELLQWIVDTRRRLAEHEPALAVDLAVLARSLGKQGRWTEAVDAATESFEIRQRLGDTGIDDPVSAAEEFLVAHLAEPELRPEYLAALRAAVTARRAVPPTRDLVN